jgi:hypothetical protein
MYFCTMKNLILASLFILTASSSCNSGEENNDDVNKTFFPIAGNINAELKELDSLPVAVIKYTTEGSFSDTTIADKAELKKASAMLTQPDISLPELKKYYREDVLMDNTINTVTMSYTTKAEEPEVRKIEVMFNAETDKVKSIYVEKLSKSGDTTVTRKMVWTPNRNLQVITLKAVPGKPENIKTEKYSFDH